MEKLKKKDYPYEWDEEGYCYKNEQAYNNDRNAICYIPEAAYDDNEEDTIDREDAYSHNDLLELCEGDNRICDILFSCLGWSCPETVLIDMELIDD